MIENRKIDVNDLVARIRGAGVSLWEEQGKLRYRAPQGILADRDLQTLKEYKVDILELLHSEKQMVTVPCHSEAKYEPFPLTDVQSAYLLGRSEVFGYGGVACHIYLELTYPELEWGRTEKVWNQLILRHDMLRAIINKRGYQQVLEMVPRLDIAYTDASLWGKDSVEAKLNEIREEMGHRIYNTDCWPLFGVAVTKTSQGTVLHFSIEFLIADWASIWLLLSEFEGLYYEPERKLSHLDLSFRDYLIAERSLRESDAYGRDKDYWLQRIDQLPAAPDLPMGKLTNHSSPTRFSRRFLQLDVQSWKGFKEKSQQHGLTPTTGVMTAYAAVLERWSRNKKFCLNLTVLNRLPLHPQVNHIVGDFTSVSLLAVDWYAGKSFSERAKVITKQLFEDLDHGLFSGVEVIREISRRRGREVAMMPIVFTSAIGLVGATNGSQLKGKFEGQGISQTPQVFIDCQAMDGASGLQINWDVREGVFPDAMIDDMFEAFASLLRMLSTTDQAWAVDETVALPAWQINERKELEVAKVPLTDQLLHSKILDQAAVAPDRPAVIDSRGPVSYGDLMLRASAVAEKLTEMGCKEQDRVAIIMDKSVHQVAAVLGTLSVGGVYVPLDAMQPELRRWAMLKKMKIRHVLTCSTNLIQWPEYIRAIEVDKLTPHRENTLRAIGDPDMPAYIIHTSGSTGQPKGVVITHRAAGNTIEDINRRFAVGPDDRILGLAQLSFDLSVYDIFGVLSVGGTLVYPEVDRQTDPSHWKELMAIHEITIWNSVPPLMQMLLACLQSEHNINLPKFRLAMLSGDWIPLTLPDTLINCVPSVQVISLGGATEGAIWSIFHVYQGLQSEWRSIPYGRPLTNQGLRVLDEKMQDCPVWVTGELYITGAGLAEGYFEEEEITKNQFFPHPVDGQRLYRTGDMGRYTVGGEIEFLGREDNQVKIKGHRIELGEIESTLLKHPAVAAAAVVVDGSGDNKGLIGFVETICVEQDGIEITVSELVDFLSKYLPLPMIPSHLQIVEALPLTDNGKIDRRELIKWRVKSATDRSAIPSARENLDPLEGQLSRIWAEALSVPVIGKLQNFYDHGADSLIMAQVAGKLRELFASEAFMINIPFDTLLRQMLNYPTIGELAEFIRLQSRKESMACTDSLVEEQRKSESNGVLIPYGGGTVGPLRVVFHNGLGTVNSFRLLLSHLNEQNIGPVIGIAIADPDLYCSLDPSGLVENLADDYAKRLIETGQKEMQLIGHCLGGLIAVEVAKRLLEQGIHVMDLVLVNSHPIPYDVDDELVVELFFLPFLHISPEQAGFRGVTSNDLERGLQQIYEANKSIPAGSSLTIGGDEGLDRVGELFKRLASLSQRERFAAYVDGIAKFNGDNMPIAMALGMFNVIRQSMKSARFMPQPYMGDLRFLQAREQITLVPGTHEMTLDFWQEICLGEFSVKEIAGNHLTCIEVEPNVSDLARVIGEVLVK